jgi:electron transfer flavoprotein beta subunit
VIGLKIIVCIKQVPDTNEVKLDPVTGTLIRDGVPSIINPDDKAGLEAALRLKDELGAEISVISHGASSSRSSYSGSICNGCR